MLAAVAACFWSVGSAAHELRWTGFATADGGVVAWEFEEAQAFASFDCNQQEKSIAFRNDTVFPGNFLTDPSIPVKVDGLDYRLRSDPFFGEMAGNCEGTAILHGDEPFLHAVASGGTMQIYDLVGRKHHPGEISPAGTGRLFEAYLSGRLIDQKSKLSEGFP